MRKHFLLFLCVLFCAINTYGSTFTSKANGGWSAVATWTVTGSLDSDGIPDLDDDVVIKTANSVTLTILQNYFKTLTIQNGATLVLNNKALYVYGDFTNLGTLSGTFNSLNFKAPSVFSSIAIVTNAGTWSVYDNLTISATTTLSSSSALMRIYNSAIVTNLGKINYPSGGITLNNSSSFVAGTNSSISVGANFTSSNNYNFSALGNTVTVTGNCKIIPTASFYNLILIGPTTKTVTGSINILNDLTLNTGGANKLDLNHFDLSIGGNWKNNANSDLLNQGIITFNGSGNQTISRAGIENINYFEINSSGTVQLICPLNVSQSFFNRSGTLDLIGSGASYSLRIQKNFTNNDRIFCNTATIYFNGTSVQSINGTTDCFFYDLKLNNPNGVTVNSPQSISNSLNIINGTFRSNGNVTLLSDEFTTAYIAKRPSGSCVITGNMIIQQYISARTKGWHNLASPVVNTTINDWDDEMYMSRIGPDDGTPGPAGVDGSAGGFSSVLTYNEPTATWNEITGSSTSVPSGKGFQVWLADDLNTWEAKVINTVGVPTYGNKQVKLSYTPAAGAYAGLNLIGNPFACAVSFSLCTRTSITGSILMLDNSGNYTDMGPNAIIPPHQGFWVGASSSTGAITFLETAKVTSNATNFYRTVPNFGIKLLFSSPSLPFYNENTINFEHKTTTNYDEALDALFIKSPNSNAPAMYMTTNSDAKLITNYINSQDDEVMIPLSLFTPEDAIYYIKPTVSHLENFNYAWIENTTTGKKYELSETVSVAGTKGETNTNFVLKLSKNKQNSTINQTVFENDISVFNSENVLNLKSFNASHLIKSISIFDLSGKMILEKTDVSLEQGVITQIDVTELQQGMYIVNITDETGHVITEKIIK